MKRRSLTYDADALVESAARKPKSGIRRSVATGLFAGPNTTRSAVEKFDRRWLAFEKDRTCLAAPEFRFGEELPPEALATVWRRHSEDLLLKETRQQCERGLPEDATEFNVRRKPTKK